MTLLLWSPSDSGGGLCSVGAKLAPDIYIYIYVYMYVLFAYVY